MRKLTKEEKEILKTAILVLEIANKNQIRTPQNLKVHHLAKDCLQAVINDKGEQTIFIPSDDEENNYHQLFYSLDTNPDKCELQLLKEYNPCMEDYKDDEIALLG